MTLQTLFDKGRRRDIQRAIARGEPLPFQRMKDSEPPSVSVPLSDVKAFILEIRESGESTKQRLDRAGVFIRAKSNEIVVKYGVDEFNRAEASVMQKLSQAEKGASVSYTPLEERMLELLELFGVITHLTEQMRTQDSMKALLGSGRKVTP